MRLPQKINAFLRHINTSNPSIAFILLLTAIFSVILMTQRINKANESFDMYTQAKPCYCTGTSTTSQLCRSIDTSFKCGSTNGCTWNCSPTPKTSIQPTVNGGSGGGKTGGDTGNTGGKSSGGTKTATDCTSVGDTTQPLPAECMVNSPVINSASVTIIGDSLTNGATVNLQTLLPAASIYAEDGRSWESGVSVLTQLVSDKKLENILVFALGTNSPGLTDADIKKVLDMTKETKVILVTNYKFKDPARYKGNNEAFFRAENPPDILVADWSTLATKEEASDTFAISTDELGVHFNDKGDEAFANLIAETINKLTISVEPPVIGRGSCLSVNGIPPHTTQPRYLNSELCSNGSIAPRYSPGFIPINLGSAQSLLGSKYWVRSSSVMLRREVADPVRRLFDYLITRNCEPLLGYGYRSYQEQSDLWYHKNCPANPRCGVAPPGSSTHQAGNTIDIFCTRLNAANQVELVGVPAQSFTDSYNLGLIHPISWDTPHFIAY